MSDNSAPHTLQTISADSFWKYSLKTYEAKAVQTELLHLQDEHEGNVNLALLCMYLDSLKLKLAIERIAQLHSQVTAFSSTYTVKIRGVRRIFKTNSGPLTNYDKIKNHLLEAELELERQEQRVLIDALLEWAKHITKETVTNNFSDYCQLLNK